MIVHGGGAKREMRPVWWGAHGFTLVELVITVAIIAILVAIAVPAYNDQVRKARRGQAQADLMELTQLAERYHSVNNSYVGFDTAATTLPLLRSPKQGTMVYDIDFQNVTRNGYNLRAVPQGGQVYDTKCMTLTLNSIGQKGITGGSGTTADCW